MNNIDKIKYLLEKKNLTPEEKQELDSILNSNPEAAEFYNTYTRLADFLKSDHISLDELRDYILHSNNLEPENKKVIEKIPEIEYHLKNCDKCTEEFKVLNQEFTDVDLFVAESFKTQEERETPPAYIQRSSNRTAVYAFASVAAIAVLYIVLLFISNITAPEYYDLASLDESVENYVTRGRATDEFQQSMKALEEKNYKSAIQFLKDDIKNNPEDATIFYSHYILGLTYLEKADAGFAGLFKSFNESDVNEGLKHLQLCIEKNNSGKYPDITYNSYFYSAKGNLMLGETEKAKEYLRMVIEEKGSKMSEAKSLLKELE